MKLFKIKSSLAIGVLLLANIFSAAAQDSTEVDASKPTNFYTQVINNLEYQSNKTGGNLMGYRAEFMFSPSDAHLILGELPLLYNDQSEKFGIGDVRARYFYLPYKNYEKTFGAFGPSIDVIAPTGDTEQGLGSGRWTFVPGVTAGIMAADWVQFFPIASYQYMTKTNNPTIPENVNKELHGLTFQIITPIVFSSKCFAQITPIYQFQDLSNTDSQGYVQEALVQYAIKPNLQVSGFFKGDFKNESYTGRLGLVVYL